MGTRRAPLACLLLAPLLAAPSVSPTPGPGAGPVLDALLEARVRLPLTGLSAQVPLAADEDFRVVELGRDAGTSHHLVAIRNAEVPHRHDRHDLLVVMVRGHGSWRVGDATRSVAEGSILYVPRGTLHAFGNESDAPAIAYAVYTPPFDGNDRVEAADR